MEQLNSLISCFFLVSCFRIDFKKLMIVITSHKFLLICGIFSEERKIIYIVILGWVWLISNSARAP